MDRMQIALKLGMDLLGIPISLERYDDICNASYLAEQRGVYICPAIILLDKGLKKAYSLRSHESGGSPSRNLQDDICEIIAELEAGFDEFKLFQLDKTSRLKLEKLGRDIKEKGFSRLLEA